MLDVKFYDAEDDARLSPRIGNSWGDYARTVIVEKGEVVEPHIAFPDSKYGFKKENIYYFDGDRLVEL